tara:strand:- start:203 stop:310 length:108 start_codon:yes stop_codon:yes gene_type:complete
MKETQRIFICLDENGVAYPSKKKTPAKKKAAKKDE